MTESDALRSALATALNDMACNPATPSSRAVDRAPPTPHVKLSVRLTRSAAHRLDDKARAAGLSRGAYRTRLIDGSPPVVASTNLHAGFAALSASASELAVLSRDISHLTHLLRTSEFRPALEYRERLETLSFDVRSHLDRAAVALAEVFVSRAGARQAQGLHPSQLTAHNAAHGTIAFIASRKSSRLVRRRNRSNPPPWSAAIANVCCFIVCLRAIAPASMQQSPGQGT